MAFRIQDLMMDVRPGAEGQVEQLADPDRFAGFEAQSLNVHVDFPMFQKIALPILSGKTKIAGIKIHDTRMMRLMEVLLHGGTQLNGWRSADTHQAILATRIAGSRERSRPPARSAPIPRATLSLLTEPSTPTAMASAMNTSSPKSRSIRPRTSASSRDFMP